MKGKGAGTSYSVHEDRREKCWMQATVRVTDQSRCLELGCCVVVSVLSFYFVVWLCPTWPLPEPLIDLTQTADTGNIDFYALLDKN